jgi:branched-chain amino acid transport system substrate-binding protein
VYHDAGVLQITPASSNPRLTDDAADEGWTTLFRTCGRDDAQGDMAGAWLAQHFAGGRVAFVHDGSGYGRLLVNRARKAMNAAGLEEVMAESISPGRTDYAGLVAKLKEAEVDAVFFGGYHIEAAAIVRGMRAQKLSAAFFGGDALQTLEFAKLAGSAASGVRFTSQPEWRLKPSAAAVVKAFRAGGFEPEGYTLSSYAAFQVWAAAVTKAGTIDAETVAATLRSQSWDTVIGPLAFDRKGDVIGPEYVWYEFQAGGYEEVGM